MIFKDEVRNVDELVAKLIDIDSLKKIKVAVVCFIFNKQGQVILNRRGPGARDDVGKLQAVGGSVNKSDADFLSALKREILEETGNNDIKISKFIGAYHDRKIDNETKEVVDWIILGYIGILESGSLINVEKSRSIDFETFNINDINPEELSLSTYEFIKEIKRMK